MKIDRMIGILSLLLQKEKMTAPELAEHFEVSKRTINRDIDDLCKAGIPICTTQGVGGGIQIMDGYRMDRTLFTSRDMQMIMAGLRSLDSVSGFFDYVVPPLEGFWWQDGVGVIDYSDKSTFNWISVIRLPDFVTPKDFDWAVEDAEKKKHLDCSKAEFLTIDEGLCVQIMHIGPFDDEPATVSMMNAYLLEKGYENDLSDSRLHHEIYLSDARKVAPEKWKTVIRYPIRRKEA